MAKGLLRLFGVLCLGAGAAAIALSFVIAGAMAVLLPWGVGLLPAGAILIGFAYGLELLEDITQNTAGSTRASNSTTPLPPRR